MIVGFNYWSRNTFGVQIGPNLHVPEDQYARENRLEAAGKLEAIPLPPLFEHIDRNLANLKMMGVKVVRWFLLGNGNNYGPNPVNVPSSYRYLGALLPISVSHYRFSPPPTIDKRFRRDFTEMLTRFRKAGMQLIPSLISFEFGGDTSPKVGNGPNYRWHGGRADVIRLPAARQVFLDTMLAELLAASKGFEEQIYAWEIINEPIWLTLKYGPLSPKRWLERKPEVTADEMRSFLSDAVARIEKAGFKSTVGHRYFGDLNEFPTGNSPQFHYYADTGSFNQLGGAKNDPSMKDLFAAKVKPFLGEFDSASNEARHAWKYSPSQADSTWARLLVLETQGCPLAMLWPDMDDRPPEVWGPDLLKMEAKTRAEVVRYTGGKLPPANE